MDKLLKVAELAQVLGITPKAVYCRLHEGRQSVPTSLLMPGSSHLRWRQSDVEVWLAVLPTWFRTMGRTPPRNQRGKTPALAGEAAVWEKYKGLWRGPSAGRGAVCQNEVALPREEGIMLASELGKVARTLSAKERARLVEVLRESLQDTPAAEVATAWNREIEARLDAYERGELQSFTTNRCLRKRASSAGEIGAVPG